MVENIVSMELIDVLLDDVVSARPRDPADVKAVALASFIQSDVQASGLAAKDWLRRLDDVEKGVEAEDDGTGNSYTLYLDSTGATIENAIFPDDPTVRLEHGDLRQALEAVLALLSRQR